eukprot:m.202550 g.202550  ORF g.202550 m.202550 type:complete len:56 (-) comp21796_c0_seq1:340-507(-)
MVTPYLTIVYVVYDDQITYCQIAQSVGSLRCANVVRDMGAARVPPMAAAVVSGCH